MEDSTSEVILEKVISKTSNMLDKTFAKFEHSLRNNIVNLGNDLNSKKVLNKKQTNKQTLWSLFMDGVQLPQG